MTPLVTNLLSSIFDILQQELNLSFGEITEEAALAVAHAVKDKDRLEKLDLNGTNPQLAVIYFKCLI